ncbi:MAG: bifunctional folylpolyglutamate synthase/dihydrofolate synthase [Algoriphagus sp.]|nr:bifunctional folylpolyglutamate synthase/dihydrofolate synthase [Algoriphagus sp.]MCE2778768.1 bifunctional folylpolyglutamate synthase/dihydrofolate synthase [Algoriphagus sp.]
MNYQETLDYLFNALPMFQRVGASAYKADLTNTIALCIHLGNPQEQFKSIHVAGTNGKGSTSHSLASIFQAAGYKTGLYTSPHLKSFTERIRINGEEINKEDVVQFVATHKGFLDQLQPSFFEMTVGLAFWYFAKEEVDIAIIEVGMGGRLDSTNVISPELCVITNIGFDHTQFLGDTLPQIAGEKAGIIKEAVPVVVSHTQKEIQSVFLQKAASMQANLVFADQRWEVRRIREAAFRKASYTVKGGKEIFDLEFDLQGDYQRFNLPGILESVEQLRQQGWKLTKEALQLGLAHVSEYTGLKGRWQILQTQPLTIADTGHNEAGILEVVNQLKNYTYSQLWMVIGMVNDKDISKVLELLPRDATYIFCQANLPRAIDAELLASKALEKGLSGQVIPKVTEAIEFARKNAGADDLIFIGGSTFVVAEIEDL